MSKDRHHWLCRDPACPGGEPGSRPCGMKVYPFEQCNQDALAPMQSTLESILARLMERVHERRKGPTTRGCGPHFYDDISDLARGLAEVNDGAAKAGKW